MAQRIPPFFGFAKTPQAPVVIPVARPGMTIKSIRDLSRPGIPSATPKKEGPHEAGLEAIE
jgi:hypothetical protein